MGRIFSRFANFKKFKLSAQTLKRQCEAFKTEALTIFLVLIELTRHVA
jgi:hypothetical protein